MPNKRRFYFQSRIKTNFVNSSFTASTATLILTNALVYQFISLDQATRLIAGLLSSRAK
ncbi:hypothetical protein WJM97_04455 [Okeanomitos corallinicola TIOX110]|uniref:Uncharacterized protein n=1 Tax=Okeanomitos corallinicola TIOX110 TaxID=3133117 RepID=A0ABZ2UU62_9CYAN